MHPDPLAIAFVNSTRKWGGVKTWTLDFGAELVRRGHRALAVVRPATPFVAACTAAGFSVHPLSFGPKYNPLAIARCVCLFRRARPDVVVVNISKDLEVGAVAAKLLGIPVLHRVGLVEDYRGALEERLRHRCLVDRVLVPARWMRDELVQRFPWLPSDQVAVVPNSKRLATDRPTPGCGTGTVVFGMASQLSPSKGHVHVLRAMQILLDKGIDVRLRVAGTGGLEASLRTEAERLSIGRSVSWEGFLVDVPAFLAELDGFVLASLKEGFPNTLLEALGAGLPTVASDLPGTREMVGDAGLLVPPADPAALAVAIGQLAAEGALRHRLGDRARARVAAHYDIETNAGRLETLLREMAAQGADQ